MTVSPYSSPILALLALNFTYTLMTAIYDDHLLKLEALRGHQLHQVIDGWQYRRLGSTNASSHIL